MNIHQIERKIKESVSVNPHMVALAKSYLINNQSENINTSEVFEQFVKLHSCSKPNTVVIHESVEIDNQIQIVSKYLSFGIAFCEAVHSLVCNSIFIPLGSQQFSIPNGVNWTTVIPGSGGQSSGWRFDFVTIPTPLNLMRPYSRRTQSTNQTFFEPDVYTYDLGLVNAHPDIIQALKDGLACFKNDLFHPAITMLGKAVEGAWIELGISLTHYVKIQKPDWEAFIEKLKGLDSLVWKVNETVKLYDRQDWFKPLKIDSGIDLNTIREIQNWTDIIRDSRNAIHFGAQPATPNTYEKASIMFIAAVKNLRSLYKLKESADKLSL
ncbi:hypothetical protein MHH60_14215 [Paenibacillus sp. FSL H7-0716]|uniref:RiboL-PSP-HEPN domain-containing protein n=1 Tax=Paenibacillus odorifer TaxID=189426 RepID=A0AB36JH62_9BACL|nr:hypothetical protein [Paenibacillus odorifer]OME23537.1 hypothetical protein BSK47_03520 [Paenibacillus odorifer]